MKSHMQSTKDWKQVFGTTTDLDALSYLSTGQGRSGAMASCYVHGDANKEHWHNMRNMMESYRFDHSTVTGSTKGSGLLAELTSQHSRRESSLPVRLEE